MKYILVLVRNINEVKGKQHNYTHSQEGGIVQVLMTVVLWMAECSPLLSLRNIEMQCNI